MQLKVLIPVTSQRILQEHNMDLYTQIKLTYPDLDDAEFVFGSIELRDDGDGIQYISKWDYSEPLPEGLTLGKPVA